MKERITYCLLSPFHTQIWFFLDIWLLTSAADCWFWSIHGNPVFGFYMASHGLIMAYLIAFLCQFLKGRMQEITEGILIFLGVINMIADAMVHHIMHFSFTQDMVAIILGTNPSEAGEFLPMYVDLYVIIFILIILCLAVVIWHFRTRFSQMVNQCMRWALFALCVLSAIVIVVRKSNNWEGVFLYKIRTFLTYETPVDLRQYRSVPTVSVDGNQPDHIILIIGESLSRNHCSVYGYEKYTQPLLEKMTADSSIIVFEDASAPYPNTVESFKQMMSTYSGNSSSGPWFKNKTFLLDAMKAAGYQTFWISNQSSTGIYDNIVTKFAELADSVIWVGTRGMGIGKHDLDGILIPEVANISKLPGKKFMVIHMMGSHEGFNSRYPSDYSVFSEADYLDKPANQRDILAAYDNSVLYNDFVVSSLFHIFDEGSNITFYCPDHGLDIYDSGNEYAGHARISIPASYEAGVTIPLFIAPSVQYMNDFPTIVSYFKKMSTEPYCTGDLIYSTTLAANSTLR